MAIELYEHNKKTYENIIDIFKIEKRAAIVQPTGTGKSFLFLKWIEDNSYNKILLLSPSTEIFKQFKDYVTKTNDSNILKNVEMITYQALHTMEETDIKNYRFDNIILDEFHRVGAEKWGQSINILLEENPNAYILGGSATPIRYLDNCKDMSTEIFYGKLACEITLGEAIKREILPMPTYVPVWYDEFDKFKEYSTIINNDIKEESKQMTLNKSLKSLKDCMELSYGASHIFEKYMPTNHGKYIVFCRNVEHLYHIIPSVSIWMYKINRNIKSYISISEQSDKSFQLDAFRQDNDKESIRLLFTVDRLNEGIHISGIDGIIMLRPTTSPIIYLQQIGRALSCKDKKPVIFDMVNNYQNVQISLSNGKKQNILEREFEEYVKIKNSFVFHIFDEMRSFNTILQEFETILYYNTDETWFNYFDLYNEFKKLYNREPKRNEMYKNIKLGNWCARQKILFLSNSLAEERINLLQNSGFDFEKNTCKLEKKWNHEYEIYKEFKKEFNREPLKKEIYKDFKIGIWCGRQKNAYNNKNLTELRIELLKEAGFDFEPQYLKAEKRWQEIYVIYKEYKRKFKREPKRMERYKGINLGTWLSNQHSAYNSGILSSEREYLLRKEGVCFEKNKLDKYWIDMYMLYKEFKDEYKREPMQREIYKGIKLGDWCSRQKTAYLQNKLSSKRELLLRENEFHFERQIDKQWDEKFALFREFKEEFGRNPSQREVYKNVNIGDWSTKQRILYHKKKLPLQREALLREYGFDFERARDKQEEQWQYIYYLYIEYKRTFMKDPIQKEIYKGIQLGAWCNRQKVLYKNNKLPMQRELLLRKAGFRF